jgi:DNA-binding transcriptional LysR family regulator
MDRLDAMNVFVTVAELRGFAPAARRLKLSPSAVTRLVAALEERLGTRLLQRTTRSVALTDGGARYLERARRILSDVAEAEATAQAERTVPSGRFVVAGPNVFGRLHIARLMCEYLLRYPAVTGELLLSDRMANLVDEGIDAAVRIGVLEDASYVARSVGITRRVVVAAPAYLKRRKAPRTPEHMGGHDLIHFTALGHAPEWRFTRDGEERRIGIKPRYITNSADAAIGHAERGGGLTMVLGYQVRDAVRAGRLQVVLAKYETAPLPIQIVYPTSRLLSAKVRAFVELCASTCDWQFVDLP